MSWLKRSLSVAVFAALVAVPAHAQISGHPIEASLGAGMNRFDTRDGIDNAFAFTGSAGWRVSESRTLELSWLNAPSTLKPSGAKHQWSYSAVDVRWNLADPAEKAVPYVLTGFGLGRANGPVGIARMGAPSLGAGFLFSLAGQQRTYLRLQVRDVMFRELNATEFSHHIASTIGVQFSWGGKAKDQDLDGVRNWLDQCPNTPIGAKVDAKGCPIDSDGDGVYDGLDKCPDTPKGAVIDKKGCPIDSDGDGVFDGLDTCPNTPKGAKVDVKGCPIDSDGDGVYDGLDKCPDTPKGAVIDKDGCPVDTDGDGVPDGLDQCPNTPKGAKVDPTGCPTEVSARETQLLQTGDFTLQNVQFDVNKASIKDSVSFATLDDVAGILLQYPMLNLEIGGHTDNRGLAAKNLALSAARAKSVMNYLLQKFPTLDASHFTTKGYGSTVPVAKNTTEAGRAQNRRVEFKVTNPEVLDAERAKRHIAPKPAAPAKDATTK